MQHIRRCSSPLISQKGLSLFLGRKLLKGVSDVGLAAFSTSMVAQRSVLGNSVTRTKKDVSTVEDPFDAPPYNIPEKPVTFTEDASYSILILAGLGVAAAAVFKELIFEPKEYKIFNKALKRIQDDSQVRVRIGSPITGYGQESRNRAARQRIPNRIFTDEDGLEHVQVNCETLEYPCEILSLLSKKKQKVQGLCIACVDSLLKSPSLLKKK